VRSLHGYYNRDGCYESSKQCTTQDYIDEPKPGEAEQKREQPDLQIQSDYMSRCQEEP
jgi:hypothetical protein